MIKKSIENNTGIIRLNRPDKRNALHPDMVEQFKSALSAFNDNDEVKSLIITGEGKSFCAGADLEYLIKLKDFSTTDNLKDSESLAELFLSIYNFPKPTIAAVNGAAIAGGCGLATVCDFIIAHPEHSKFGYSEVKIGFIPAVVSIFLIKRLGEGSAKQLMLTGEYINGERAYQLGLVNYLSENPFNRAEELSQNLNKNSTLSIKMTKKILHTISNMNVEDAVKYCIKLNTISRTTEDFNKGLSNFLTKK